MGRRGGGGRKPRRSAPRAHLHCRLAARNAGPCRHSAQSVHSPCRGKRCAAQFRCSRQYSAGEVRSGDRISPGEKAYHSREVEILETDAEVHGLYPHMHLIGKEIKVMARLPDGTQRSLLWIDAWDFSWHNYYECKTPVTLPKGTEIVMEST